MTTISNLITVVSKTRDRFTREYTRPPTDLWLHSQAYGVWEEFTAEMERRGMLVKELAYQGAEPTFMGMTVRKHFGDEIRCGLSV